MPSKKELIEENDYLRGSLEYLRSRIDDVLDEEDDDEDDDEDDED